VNARDNNGRTALMYAADWKEVAPYESTTRFPIGIIQHSTTRLITPPAGDSTGVVGLLLYAGADLNAKDKDGKTALMYAAENGHADAVRSLLDKGADVNAKDNGGWTAKDWALYNNKSNVVPILEEAEKRLTSTATASKSENKLIDAAGSGDVSSVQTLLNKGANIELKNEYGYTALMYAAYYGHADVVRFLLNKGADVNAKDTYGRTALSLAGKGGYGEIVRILKDAGAK